MTETPPTTTRRKFLQNTGFAAAWAAIKPRDMIAQPSPNGPVDNWSKEFPGNWPVLSEEEKCLMRLPLTKPQARDLLEYKVNNYALGQISVVHKLKDLDLLPHKVSWAPDSAIAYMAKTIGIGGFYDNIIAQYNKKNEPTPTVGDVWKRFWEQGSNHYYEEAFKQKLKMYRKYANGTAPYSEEDNQKLQRNNDRSRMLLGEENLKLVQHYVQSNFDKILHLSDNAEHHLNNDNIPFAAITRAGPQLDFPHVTNKLGINTDMLKITRNDLKYALKMDVDKELTALREKERTGAQR